jgi:hypothetical protein
MALVLLVEANWRLVARPLRWKKSPMHHPRGAARAQDDVFRGQLLLNHLDPQMQALGATASNRSMPLQAPGRQNRTKVYKFAASQAARAIVGQSRSTIDLAWVRDGAVVIVDGAREQVGTGIAALAARS